MAKKRIWSGRGILNMRIAGTVTIIGPGDPLDDAALAELGQERVRELEAAGQIESINFIEGTFNIIKQYPGALSAKEREEARLISQNALDLGESMRRLAATNPGPDAFTPKEDFRLTSMNLPGASRSAR